MSHSVLVNLLLEEKALITVVYIHTMFSFYAGSELVLA